MLRRILSMSLAAVLLAVFSGAAFAAAPTTISLEIRNQTGAPVSLALTAADGTVQFHNLQVGHNILSLPNGIYEYYASMQCGNLAGNLNLNVSKLLLLNCPQTQTTGTVADNSVFTSCLVMTFAGGQGTHMLNPDWFSHKYSELNYDEAADFLKKYWSLWSYDGPPTVVDCDYKDWVDGYLTVVGPNQ